MAFDVAKLRKLVAVLFVRTFWTFLYGTSAFAAWVYSPPLSSDWTPIPKQASGVAHQLSAIALQVSVQVSHNRGYLAGCFDPLC